MKKVKVNPVIWKLMLRINLATMFLLIFTFAVSAVFSTFTSLASKLLGILLFFVAVCLYYLTGRFTEGEVYDA